MTRRIAALLALLALLFGAVACGGDDDDAGGADDSSSETTEAGDTGTGTDEGDDDVDPDGVVRIGYDLVSEAKGGFTLNPKESLTNVGDLGVYQWIYGSLVHRTADGELVPDLAESAEVVDANTVEVVLRDGVEYSDGTPMTPEDVKASIESNLEDPASPAFNADFHSLESITVSEDGTLVFSIPDGTAPSWFDSFIANVETVPVRLDNDFRAPVGAGPMVVTSFRPEQTLVLEKNPSYWDADAIQVAGAELIHVSGAQSVSAALRSGQIDFGSIDNTQLDAVRGTHEIASRAAQDRIITLPMCKTVAPFDDARVRRALSISIDRDAINEALYGGTAIPAATQFPPDHPLYLDGIEEAVAFDPDEARELVAEAGAEGVTFDLMVLDVLGMGDVAQVIQQQWADVGIEANLVNATNFVQDYWIDKKAPMALIPLMSDPLAQWVGDATFNHCPLNDPVLEELTAQTEGISQDSDEAAEVWGQIQQHMIDEALGIFVLYQPSITAYDAERLGGEVREGGYFIPLPDLWDLYVKA
ncbi:MAG TPA: ABC transporter substrate-binding protein [Acidimicrobiales bacterium]|nr:ABC transporter substrate-binding protein [Acidimicrobiales bacterium]